MSDFKCSHFSWSLVQHWWSHAVSSEEKEKSVVCMKTAEVTGKCHAFACLFIWMSVDGLRNAFLSSLKQRSWNNCFCKLFSSAAYLLEMHWRTSKNGKPQGLFFSDNVIYIVSYRCKYMKGNSEKWGLNIIELEVEVMMPSPCNQK